MEPQAWSLQQVCRLGDTVAHTSVFSLPGVQGGEAIADLGARVPAARPGQQWDRRSAAQRPWELPPGLAR